VPVQTDDFAEFYEASYRRMVALVAAIVGDRPQAETSLRRRSPGR